MYPFRPVAETQSTAVTGTSQSVTINETLGNRTLRVVNDGSQVVYIEFGRGAAATAVVGTSFPVLANTVEVFTLDATVDRYAVIAATTGSTIRTTVGEGE